MAQKILLVEDDPCFGSVLKSYLELSDYEVTLCVNGNEGLETFRKDKFDICLLDVMMPEMDGFTLGKKIREINTSVPFVYITAKNLKEDVKLGYEIGADDYIVKPFDSEVLILKIKAILSRSKHEEVEQPKPKLIHIGQYEFNTELRVISKNDEQIKLTPKEARLLEKDFLFHCSADSDNICSALGASGRAVADPIELWQRCQERTCFLGAGRYVWRLSILQTGCGIAVIIFFRDGRYLITPVADKKFIGKNILYANVFKKNDKRTIYNVVYRDGKEGTCYIKRFAVTNVVRDREYDVTQGTPDSRIMYFTANPNGEAEIIKVTLKPNPRIRKIIFEEDFSQIGIKGRQTIGNILTRNPVHKITLKQRGGSTLGGRKVWFDRDVLRLNYDGRGEFIGEYQTDEKILIVLENGDFYTSNFDLNNHYEDNIRIIEKFEPDKVWTAVLYDADQQNMPYIKRFCFEASARKQNYLGENKQSRLILLTDEYYPRLELVFGGHDSFRDPLIVEADEFIAVKGFKAKGKRLTTYTLDTVNELEPTRQPEPKPEPETRDEEPENLDPDRDKSQSDIIDEITGQMKLF